MDPDHDDDWYVDNVLAYAEPGRARPLGDGPVALWNEWWRKRYLDAGNDPAARIAREQGFVLTLAQWHEAGFSDNDLRREVRRGNWWRPARGVASPVVITGTKPSEQRKRHALASTAAALLRPGRVVSGRSAAIVTGLPTLEVPSPPELTGEDAALGRRRGAHVHAATLLPGDITTWYGTSITTTSRTIVDAARHDRRDGLMAADAALRERITDAASLAGSLAQAARWPGVKGARSVLGLATPHAESPLESLLRLALHDDGFPTPKPQGVIHDPARGKTYYVDLLFAEQRLVIEADGSSKYTDADDPGEVVWKEKRRESRLRALGFRVERVLWSDMFAAWPETRARLWAALRG